MILLKEDYNSLVNQWLFEKLRKTPIPILSVRPPYIRLASFNPHIKPKPKRRQAPSNPTKPAA